jgi:hypothetical protein
MRDVYLDFRLPWPAKIAAGMLKPGKWRPFEIYLTTTWTAPYFDHTSASHISRLFQHQIEWFLHKNKKFSKIRKKLRILIQIFTCHIWNMREALV